MDFELHTLSDELLFVRWRRNPTPASESAFLSLLGMLLDEACGAVYLITDAHDGLLTSPRALRWMTELSYHAQFGGAVTYGQKVAAAAQFGAFRRMAAPGEQQENMVQTVDEALDHLEALKPGVTAPIDREVLELLYGYAQSSQ
jgi:hypothetical protein